MLQDLCVSFSAIGVLCLATRVHQKEAVLDGSYSCQELEEQAQLGAWDAEQFVAIQQADTDEAEELESNSDTQDPPAVTDETDTTESEDSAAIGAKSSFGLWSLFGLVSVLASFFDAKCSTILRREFSVERSSLSLRLSRLPRDSTNRAMFPHATASPYSAKMVSFKFVWFFTALVQPDNSRISSQYRIHHCLLQHNFTDRAYVDLLAPRYHRAPQAGHLLHIRGVFGAQESQPIVLTALSGNRAHFELDI